MWGDLAASGPEELARKVAPYTGPLVRWFAQEVGSFGMMTVQFLIDAWRDYRAMQRPSEGAR